MTIDVPRRIGAVTREILTREHEGKPARVLVAARDYDTTIDDAWDALTSAERIPRWFMPITGELRLGGRYQLVGNAGGTITRCEPPRRLALTWEYGDEVSWLDVTLCETPQGTRLVLEHVAHVDDKRWKEFGPGAVGIGWDLALRGLERHFATGGGATREEKMAWMGSPEGKAFMRQSSEEWRKASVAAGTDVAEAAAAAARTTAAYTGEAEPSADA